MKPSKYLCSTRRKVKHLRAHHFLMNGVSDTGGSLASTMGQQHALGSVSYCTYESEHHKHVSSDSLNIFAVVGVMFHMQHM